MVVYYMVYVDNPRMINGGSVELHKVHTQQQKCNLDTQKLGVVECLDKYEVTCCDEDVVVFLDEGVVKCLDNKNKDNFNISFFLEHLLGYIIEETLGGW